jgi:hypothetical protein
MSFNFQRCTGVDEDGQRCGFALANKHSTNTCIKHHLSHSLERTGKFDSMLIYISPLDPKDNRRWLGCLPTSGSSSFVLPHLTHTMPVPSKIGSLLKEAVVKKLAEDPSTSTSEISIGHALEFCPISGSLAAANKKTTQVFPYLLNMVSYNLRRCEFHVVAWVLMSKLSGDAYKKAFGKVFQITTNCHSHFNHGNGVTAWIVNFCDAQYNGIASNLENIPDFVITGDVLFIFREMRKKQCKKFVSTKVLKSCFVK